MDTVTYRSLRFTLLGAATSLAAASAIRRLTASCGLVLLVQILTRTTWITIIAVSTRLATVTASADFQSAVSPETSLSKSKRKIRTCACFSFHTIFFFVGTSFSKEVPRLGAWQGEEERRSPVATG